MAKLTINPMTRIEGHIKVETKVQDGKVVDARVSGEMFRGFEVFLQSRNPFDAARITQRVCGVCHEVHGVASVLALEDLYKVEPTESGRLLRDMHLGLHVVADHILHFYILSLADWVDFKAIVNYRGKDEFLREVKEWVVKRSPVLFTKRPRGRYLSEPDVAIPLIANYMKALRLLPECGKGMAIFGGKAPFAHTLFPGGVTAPVSVDRLSKFASVVGKVKEFVYTCYIPDAMLLARYFIEYFDIGYSYPNLYCHRSFYATGEPLFEAKVMIHWEVQDHDFSKVREELKHSWYDGPDEGFPFFDSVTKPNPRKPGAYSWMKSPRYDGHPMETGPLARMFLNEDKEFFGALDSLGVPRRKAISTMGRILARAYEAKRIIDYVDSIVFLVKPSEPTIKDISPSTPVTGTGLGLSMAARGALTHFIKAQSGRIVNYQMIMPTTWNFGPRDSRGIKGPVEKALIGTPVENPPDLLEVGRVVRSYDPCTACSIH